MAQPKTLLVPSTYGPIFIDFITVYTTVIGWLLRFGMPQAEGCDPLKTI